MELQTTLFRAGEDVQESDPQGEKPDQAPYPVGTPAHTDGSGGLRTTV